jgi:hypothetical protein
MKSYARYIVYARWPTAPGEPEDIYRPQESFHTSIEAIDYFDSAIADDANGPGPTCQYKLIDLEHLDLGDVMLAPEFRATVEENRKRIAAANKRAHLQHHDQGDAASTEAVG